VIGTTGFKIGDRVIVIRRGKSMRTDQSGVHANRDHSVGMRGVVVDRYVTTLIVLFDGREDQDEVWGEEVRVLDIVEQVAEV